MSQDDSGDEEDELKLCNVRLKLPDDLKYPNDEEIWLEEVYFHLKNPKDEVIEALEERTGLEREEIKNWYKKRAKLDETRKIKNQSDTAMFLQPIIEKAFLAYGKDVFSDEDKLKKMNAPLEYLKIVFKRVMEMYKDSNVVGEYGAEEIEDREVAIEGYWPPVLMSHLFPNGLPSYLPTREMIERVTNEAIKEDSNVPGPSNQSKESRSAKVLPTPGPSRKRVRNIDDLAKQLMTQKQQDQEPSKPAIKRSKLPERVKNTKPIKRWPSWSYRTKAIDMCMESETVDRVAQIV